MGYESTFSGALHPNKPIPEDLVTLIVGADCSISVQPDGQEGLDYDGEPGDIVPSSRNMRGYSWAEDVFRITRLLSERDVKLTGTLYRSGEDSTDHERITVRNGRVFTAQAEFVYRNRREITAEDITHYAVRVVRRDEASQRFLGWLAKGVCDEQARIIRCAKKHDSLPPPLHVTRFDTEAEAREAIGTLERPDDLRCIVVKWEDPL